MTRTFEQWAESEGLDMSVDWKGELTSPVTAGALRGWEAAQSAGQEAIYQVRTSVSGWRDLTRAQYEDSNLDKRIVYAAPVNGGERELGQVIDERDQYHDAAEKLADAIAKHFGVEIGEHSNLNCPWQNALDHIAQATKRAADAPQVGGDLDAEANALVAAIMEEVRARPTASNAYGLKVKAKIKGAIVAALARAALSADGGEDKRDAERWRFLREEHEGTESFDDAEGFTITEPTARAFTVFKPGRDVHLEPVGCMPGELDGTIDAAIAAKAKGDE